MDKKFYLVNENLKCPHCGSDKIVILGESEYTGNTNIVKCGNCGAVMMESDLDEKEEEENEK